MRLPTRVPGKVCSEYVVGLSPYGVLAGLRLADLTGRADLT